LRAQTGFTGSKIRVHGDFHLGQSLSPGRPTFSTSVGAPEPRPAPVKAPARDVADSLRSIDYATSAAIDRAPTNGRALVLGPDSRWGARLSERSGSYRETLARMNVWPADEAKARLLNLFSSKGILRNRM
jgi:maltose alpha-D-glucosyltransferase/alpha-amylase